MPNEKNDVLNAATTLSRNPLGIIALFIVLVYSIATLFAATSSGLTTSEKVPLIYFIIIYPVLVLTIFTWLVIKHPVKLFAPTDFKNERNYIETIQKEVSTATSLALAVKKDSEPYTEINVEEIVKTVNKALSGRWEDNKTWRNHILWVDDRPQNNIYERKAFSELGIRFTLALSTDEALTEIENHRFAAIISDMGRQEGPREGYKLLDTLRQRGNQTPLFFYAGSNAPEHKKETEKHGGQGCTNNAQELFQMVTKSIILGS
ncbi:MULTISPECIES: response regulator [unclassified Azospirillum]|uniref:response regulator n=1 Tax=unclassified Azospirillum TaxID=2630922 RepID=UPI000B6F0D44|nr:MULTISPECIES: response regulator [unclassified Azospirillum]SNS39809.1 Response regulator receiver domain-containing protein [Azospirillum sp. RU38E]SNS58215.1 Response regulator receiver domain-containing protein [Azospirillum sp. RU37A]